MGGSTYRLGDGLLIQDHKGIIVDYFILSVYRLSNSLSYSLRCNWITLGKLVLEENCGVRCHKSEIGSTHYINTKIFEIGFQRYMPARSILLIKVIMGLFNVIE